MKSATAITKVYGEGQKFIAVAVEYDTEIDTSALSPSSFKVEGRTVARVYANTAAATADQGTNGTYVIVELSPDDDSALLWGISGPYGNGGGGGNGGGNASAKPSASQPQPQPQPQSKSSSSSSAAQPTQSSGTPGVVPGPTLGATGGAANIKKAQATVIQTGTVTTTGGSTYAADSAAKVTTSRTVNPVVDDFKQFTFQDPKTGKSLPYNLYIPKGYDKDDKDDKSGKSGTAKSYPLVLFMHDASVVSTTVKATLVQGLGAVCWAGPEDQAVREAFVLAPQYPSVVVSDDYKPTAYFDATANLVEELTSRYRIDADRLYSTGQSMGAMMTLGLNIKYPDLFAASFVVAGQWPAAQAAPLAKKNLWITVSEGDTKAYPGENAITKVIEQAGTKVARATWNGRSTAAQFATDVEELEAKGTTVNYSAFLKGTTLTATQAAQNPNALEHNSTWPIAYTIEDIREWIFKQRRVKR
ncbi:PHB depolymerase family esterase [Streptomyces xylophagus]|uniref:PHB depolymerase family esterase n=1 Tax=Streptomyces xylophagus TaxID=285514 RepID=UPI00068F2E29|nr:PHB depolymerase family esterase [Streptomyces xylophagus]